MKQYLKTRTSYYAMLFLIGVITLLIAAFAALHEFTSWFLALVGAVMVASGTVYLIYELFFQNDNTNEQLSWKISKNIVSFLKATLFEIDIIVIAATYVFIALRIAVALSLV